MTDCPDCGFQIFDDSDEFVSGGGLEVTHSIEGGVHVEEFSCPHCGETLEANYDDRSGGESIQGP